MLQPPAGTALHVKVHPLPRECKRTKGVFSKRLRFCQEYPLLPGPPHVSFESVVTADRSLYLARQLIAAWITSMRSA